MSTVVKDLGAVSAYAYAVEKGYTGTEAEFAELMADYAEVGQRAEDAANSALESKTAAQTAATTATNKASEAATSAQTATTKAGEATTAAGTATTAKNDAVAAKTAAETAQGKAEDAQAAAESVAESIPSDYSQLSEDVSDLKEDLSEVSAVDYLDIFVETTDTYISINGTETSGSYHGSRDVLKGETYKIKSSAGPSVRPYVFMVNGQVVDYYEPAEAWGTKHDYDITFTAPSDGILYINTTSYTYIGLKRVDVVSSSQANVNENTKKINDFSTVYESVNLFDASQYNLGFKRNNGVVSTDESFCYTKPIYLEAGSYLYPSTQSLFGNNDKVYLTDEWGVNISASASDYQINADVIGAVTQAGKYNSRDIKKFTLTGAHYVCINIGKVVVSDTPTAPQLSNFMLIAGSTVDDYPMYIQGVGVQQRIKYNLLNALSGLHYKVAIFDGDSISAGASVGSTDPTYRYGWGGRIGKANDMNWRNLSVSGGVITSALNSALTGKHSVVDTIDTIYASYPDLDYYIFEGGTNDADLLGNAIADPTILGTFSETDFSGSYDITTFTGAMETICSKAINYWKGKRIGYVVAPKMGYRTTSWDANTVNRRAYFERAMKVCEKWGVPYINLWDGCYLNPANPSCYDRSLTTEENIAQGYLYVDGQHLTAKGYDYISPIIEAWMKTL